MRVLTTVLAVMLLVPALLAERSGSVGSMPKMQAADPLALAREDYKSGQRRLDNVAKLTAKLKEATDAKDAEKLQQKITKQLESAAGDFKRAVRGDATLFPACSELGFALRKLGKYEDSLAAYDKALEIEPRYGPAIEYRAEAYLGLNRLDEAKQAYQILFTGDRASADVLFAAMKQWVADRTANPVGVDAAQLEQFGKWVEQREAIHRQTGALTSSRETIRTW